MGSRSSSVMHDDCATHVYCTPRPPDWDTGNQIATNLCSLDQACNLGTSGPSEVVQVQLHPDSIVLTRDEPQGVSTTSDRPT
jgi:hypothetical protein